MMKNNLQGIIKELSMLQFEAVILTGALIILVAGLITRRDFVYQAIFGLTLLFSLFFIDIPNTSVISATGAIEMDALGGLMKLLFAAISIWILFYRIPDRRSEHYLLIMSIILGSSLMLSANHLLLLYLCIELTSFSAYMITGFGFSKQSYEAAIKYLLFGGVSSAIMLYGISLIYGLSGGMRIDEMSGYLSNAGALSHFGMVCVLGGLFFKISIVPFHIWVPSTYQEAPTDGVAILSILPKIAGFVLLHRILIGFDLLSSSSYQLLIALVGILTVLMGTFGALRQQHPKRMLAYGAIAHSGLLLATLLIKGEQGGVAFVWYSITYAIMTVAVFHLISMHEENGIVQNADYKGIGIKKPFLGAIMLWILVALIGLPPTAGFTAKFYLFSSMWTSYEHTGELFMLTFLIVGVLSVVLSLFYYLKIPYEAYISKGTSDFELSFENISIVIATIFSIVLLWMFISPELLNKIAFNINFIAW